jgi:hypothetical protein
VLHHVAQVRVEPPAHALERGAFLRHRRDRRDQLVRDLGEPRDVEIALRREVVVEQALGDLRRAREGVDRDLVVGLVRERAPGEREQLRAAASAMISSQLPLWAARFTNTCGR